MKRFQSRDSSGSRHSVGSTIGPSIGTRAIIPSCILRSTESTIMQKETMLTGWVYMIRFSDTSLHSASGILLRDTLDKTRSNSLWMLPCQETQTQSTIEPLQMIIISN